MTPDQIKTALKCCGNGCAYGCPYGYMDDHGIECMDQLCKDALALIGTLEAENEKREGQG